MELFALLAHWLSRIFLITPEPSPTSRAIKNILLNTKSESCWQRQHNHVKVLITILGISSQIDKAFELNDVDGDGRLSKDEMATMMGRGKKCREAKEAAAAAAGGGGEKQKAAGRKN
jgi:Ca2+-binding EF-hand superfamily protein